MVISHLRTKRLSPFSHSNTHFGDPIPSPTVIHRPTVPENRECSRARSDTSELLEPHGGYGMIWPLSGARPYSTTQRHGGAVPVASGFPTYAGYVHCQSLSYIPIKSHEEALACTSKVNSAPDPPSS
jgi:hypothetical protein